MKQLPWFVTYVWLVCLAIQPGSCSAEAPDPPNIVFIMADDLGIGDVRCYGGDRCRIETPHLDRLAAEGLRFTDAHTVASVCVPTRVAIMTGRYAWRFQSPRPDGPWGFLNPRIAVGRPTLGTLLQTAGYHTAYIGKWHLGTRMPTTDGKNQGPDNVDYTRPLTVCPTDYGFDESFILPGSLDMYPYVFVRNRDFVGRVTAKKGWSAFNRVGPAAEDFEDVKVLDTFCNEAESFLARRGERKQTKPFFLYFALTAPHTPISPSQRFRGSSSLGLYGDFVQETDDCVGRVLDALQQHGLTENTLVIATSDHGPGCYAGNRPKATKGQLKELEKLGHYSSGIYRGYKFSVYEGGLRVPLLARWPARIPPGRRCDRLVGLHDLLATLADVAGHKRQENVGPDSISFAPLFTDPQAETPRQKQMVMTGTHGWVFRSNQWKLALCPGSGSAGVWGNTPPAAEAWRRAVDQLARRPTAKELLQAPFVQLFDLQKDPGEEHNVAAQHPQLVKQLADRLQQQIAAGRSTPGPKLPNDRMRIDVHDRIPDFARPR